MKLVSCILFLSLFSGFGCQKPPVYRPGVTGSRGESSLDNKIDPSDKPVLPGEKDGVPTEVSDAYLGLQCNIKEPKGLRAWRRLSNVEFKNTVTSVFSVTGIDYGGLPDDISRIEIYDTMMIPINFVDTQRFRAYQLVAKAVAAKADLSRVFPCLKEGAACITKTLPDLGLAAWRRPLGSDETNKLTAIFTDSVPDIGADDAARLVIQALMLSESFIYRSELGVKTAEGIYELTDWEIASALSYTILRMPPDSILRGLATKKELSSSDAIKAQVTRLFADPKAKTAWKDFANMWLDARAVLDADRPGAKDFTADLKKRTMDEVGDLFSEVFNKASDSSLEALLSADSIPGAVASSIYEVMPSAGRIQFKEPERRGVLGQGSFLVSTSAVTDTSPVKRGAFVIERLLCTGFAPAPIIKLPPRVPGESNRVRYQKLEAIPGCNNCHTPMNQFGFAFDNFDHLGKFRTEADGEKVKIESQVNIDGKMIKVHSAAELSTAIATSAQGQECFARHIFRYSLGRHEYAPIPIIGAARETVLLDKQAESDSCQIKGLTEAMAENSGDMKSSVIQLLTSSSFRERVARSVKP